MKDFVNAQTVKGQTNSLHGEWNPSDKYARYGKCRESMLTIRLIFEDGNKYTPSTRMNCPNCNKLLIFYSRIVRCDLCSKEVPNAYDLKSHISERIRFHYNTKEIQWKDGTNNQ